jgi:hypothetical protein
MDRYHDYIYDRDGDIMGCRLCGAEAYWDEIGEAFVFTCPCGEIDTSNLGEEYAT